jgi:hypothetical protein
MFALDICVVVFLKKKYTVKILGTKKREEEEETFLSLEYLILFFFFL